MGQSTDLGLLAERRGQPGQLSGAVPVFDASTLTVLSGEIEEAVFSEILVGFAEDIKGRLDRIARAAANANLQALAFESHAVSSSSYTFGALRMAHICRGIERAVDRGDGKTALELARSLGQLGVETLDAMAHHH